MPDIKQHADYEVHNTTYVRQQAAAQAARDEVAEGKAENAWLQAQLKMNQELSDAQAATVEYQTTLARMKTEYPDVPEAAYEHVTNPAQLEKLVKELAPKFVSTATQTEDKPAVRTGSGQAPSGSGTPPPAGNQDPWQDQKHLKEVRETIRNKAATRSGKEAAEAVQKEVFTNMMLPQMSVFGPARQAGIDKGRKNK